MPEVREDRRRDVHVERGYVGVPGRLCLSLIARADFVGAGDRNLLSLLLLPDSSLMSVPHLDATGPWPLHSKNS